MAAGLALVAIAVGLPGLAEIGVTWDEPNYYESVERIQSWTTRLASADWGDAMSPEAIRAAWDSDRYYNPHPPAYKVGMAITDALFDELAGVPSSYRVSSLLMFGLLVFLVSWFTARFAGLGAGVAAGLSLVLMPRVFGHAHIAATDMPLTLFWFGATSGLFLYALERRRGWLVAGAAFLGLGLATKFTAFLLPVPLALWMLLQERSRRSVTALGIGLAIALLVATAVNPAAWFDPVGYQVRLIAESLSREATVPVSTFYRGASYAYVVPWEHAIVLTVITVPVSILGLAAVGVKMALRRQRTRSLVVLCVIQLVFWLALMALPTSPNHDGVRLWLPMFPFVAVAAGLGFGVLLRAARRRLAGARANAAGLMLGLLFFAPPMYLTVHSSPYFLSAYNEVVGYTSGAAERGMEASYWFDAVTETFRDSLNTVLPDSARVWAHPSDVYFRNLQQLGLLREDLVFVPAPPTDYLLLLGRRAMFDAALNDVYRDVRPRLANRLDDVELVGLYEWERVAGQVTDSIESPAPTTGGEGAETLP